jgi:opacity protein-like surface antigen
MDILDGANHHAVLALEGSHPSDNRERYNTGIEYTFNDFAFFRIGNRFQRDLGGFTVGGGLAFDVTGKFKARIDYGFQEFDALEDVQRFALTVDF